MNKNNDFKRWVTTATDQLETYNNMTKEDGQNALRHAIKKLRETSVVFNDSFKWWKNSIDTHAFHEAETLSKRVNALHSTLELEYNRKD